MNAFHEPLKELLLRREHIIADHAWRDRDPDAHLDALRTVSEEISGWAETHRASAGAKLRHFLDNASFAKALAMLQDDSAKC
ncbi:MAG: hypothetical protein V4733_10145 [Verrucomicrobiota bacterium]